MTEHEWLNCADVDALLFELSSRAGVSERKLRLFALACAQRVWHLMPPLESEYKQPADAIAAAERRADAAGPAATAADAELYGTIAACCATYAAAAVAAADRDPGEAAGCAVHAVYCTAMLTGFGVADAPAVVWSEAGAAGLYEEPELDAAERSAQERLLRDIFGNPFRSRTALATTRDVVGLAQSIDVDRTFGDLRKLADALEAAGCRDTDILDHCRDGGEHVRGCWVIDLLLGK
ncbi:MAG TPA: hypothetical protein VF796_06380 [Humisphaera sp.]